MRAIAERLVREHKLSERDLSSLIALCDDSTFDYLRQEATRTAHERFGYGIFLRGLIEISSYCKNDCLYCGLRRSNSLANRYRLSQEQILACCREGYALGLRTFVLQGGEDAWWSDERLEQLIHSVKQQCEGVAVTLSLGERSHSSYERLRRAGADRYLLRHEAADRELYESLHPQSMSYAGRMEAISALKELGYQTGVGMMIGVKGQSVESIVKDMLFMQQLQPHMIGIGPFIPHGQTPLGGEPAGDLRLTLLVVAIARLLFPRALIPSTTALSTLSGEGVKLGVLSGANVVMPNLSPLDVRAKYSIYDGKASSGVQAAEGIGQLGKELCLIGYHIDFSRGDY